MEMDICGNGARGAESSDPEVMGAQRMQGHRGCRGTEDARPLPGGDLSRAVKSRRHWGSTAEGLIWGHPHTHSHTYTP